MFKRRKQLLAAASVMSSAVLSTLQNHASAASYTWTGSSSTTWSTAGNWNPSGPPTSTDTAVLPATVTTNQPNVTANTAVDIILFGGTTNGWTLSDSSGAVLALDGTTGASAAINDASATTGAFTFSTNLQVAPSSGTNQAWTIGAATSTMTANFTGNIDLNGNTLTITSAATSGTDTFNLNTGAIQSSATGSAGNLTLNGASSSHAVFNLTGANTYVGNTTMSADVVNVNSLPTGSGSSALGNPGASNTIEIATGGSNTQLVYDGATTSPTTVTALITFGGSGTPTFKNNGSGAIDLSNTGAANAGTTPNITLQGTYVGTNTFAEQIGGSAALTVSSTTADNDIWDITNTGNNFSGAVNAQTGFLEFDNPSELGTSGNVNLGTSSSTGTIIYNGPGVSTGLTLDLIGTGTAGGSIQSLGSGALDLTSTTPIAVASTASNKTLFLAGSNTGNNTLAAPITNSSGGGTVGVTKQNAGTWILTGASTYTGATTLSATGGTLVLGAGGSLANTAISVASGDTFQANAATSAGNTATAAAGATMTVASGGILSLADGTIGNFNLIQGSSFAGSALTLGGATLDFDLGQTSADDLIVTGTVAYTGTQSVNLSLVGNPTSLAATDTLIEAGGETGAADVVFASDGLTTETITLSNGAMYDLTLSDPAYTEVLTATAVPEPATLGLMIMGATGLLARRRSRRT